MYHFSSKAQHIDVIVTEQEEAWTSPDDTELGNGKLEPSAVGVVTKT